MTAASLTFHRGAIRLVKGVVTLWEQWVQDEASSVVLDHLKSRRHHAQRGEVDTPEKKG